MKVRADSAFLSSVLYTVALLSLVRQPALWHYYATSDAESLDRLGGGYRRAAEMEHLFGIACLVIILIGLIVLWTGYVKRSRSAWLVMFVIASVWAFPPFVLPLLKAKMVLTFPEWLYTAIYGSGPLREAADYVVIFSLMVIALLFPIRSFFSHEIEQKVFHRQSLKLISTFATVVLIAAVALCTWIRIGVVYTIPPDMLMNYAQPWPPPPSAPAVRNCE